MKNSAHKPAGYTSVAPYLIVNNAGDTIQFLTAVFDAQELRKFTGPNGRVVHAEVRIDDTVVMLAEDSGSFPPLPAHVHVYVSDVDAAYARAIKHGAESIQEPVKGEDEDKRGGVKDSGGTTWWLATKVG
ncbi:MAG: VOC family protein [Limisphaerales bacterium]